MLFEPATKNFPRPRLLASLTRNVFLASFIILTAAALAATRAFEDYLERRSHSRAETGKSFFQHLRLRSVPKLVRCLSNRCSHSAHACPPGESRGVLFIAEPWRRRRNSSAASGSLCKSSSSGSLDLRQTPNRRS